MLIMPIGTTGEGSERAVELEVGYGLTKIRRINKHVLHPRAPIPIHNDRTTPQHRTDCTIQETMHPAINPP